MTHCCRGRRCGDHGLVVWARESTLQLAGKHSKPSHLVSCGLRADQALISEDGLIAGGGLCGVKPHRGTVLSSPRLVTSPDGWAPGRTNSCPHFVKRSQSSIHRPLLPAGPPQPALGSPAPGHVLTTSGRNCLPVRLPLGTGDSKTPRRGQCHQILSPWCCLSAGERGRSPGNTGASAVSSLYSGRDSNPADCTGQSGGLHQRTSEHLACTHSVPPGDSPEVLCPPPPCRHGPACPTPALRKW